MTVTVLDSNNLPAILKDAGVEIEPAAADPKSAPAAETKSNGSDTKTVTAAPDADDVEGEDGLTPRQKRELTANIQKAIGKKHRMMKEAEEFAAAQYSERKLAEERAARLEQELARAKGAPAKAADASAEQEKPKRENFGTESEFLDASIAWGVQEGLRKKAEADAKEAAERAQAQLLEAARARISKAMELVPDYQDVVGGVDIEVPPSVAGYMQKSELFAELGYHLAKNPELLVSLAKLPPDEQLVKIGKIEGTIKPFGQKTAQDDTKSSQASSDGEGRKAAPSAETGTAPSKPRNAAPVITPLEGTGSAGVKDSKDMNIREAISDWSKRNRVNLERRKRH